MGTSMSVTFSASATRLELYGVNTIHIRMRPHLILVVDKDQDEISWRAVTLAYLYYQLGIASKLQDHWEFSNFVATIDMDL